MPPGVLFEGNLVEGLEGVIGERERVGRVREWGEGEWGGMVGERVGEERRRVGREE